jgi:hypothetical protein
MTFTRRPSVWYRNILIGVLAWLCVAGGAFWMHRRPPVTDVILHPFPGWQLQVWYGTRTMISTTADQASPVEPLVVVFYETPFTGVRRLARTTLPLWPLAISTAVFVSLALAVICRPLAKRRRR